MKRITLITLLLVVIGSIGSLIWVKGLSDETEPNTNIEAPTTEEIKYHIFDGIEGYVQHPKAKNRVLTWEEFLEAKETTLKGKSIYLLFTHHNYHLESGHTTEQYIIDYYYPNDMEGLNTQQDYLNKIYFIDLGDERNYDLLWDDNGIWMDEVGEPIDLDTLKIGTYPVMIGTQNLDGENVDFINAIVGHSRVISFHLRPRVQTRVEIRLEYKDDLDSEWASGNNPYNFNYDDYFSDIEWRMEYKENFNKYWYGQTSQETSQEQVKTETYNALCQSATEDDTSVWQDTNGDGEWQEGDCS